VNPDIKRRWIEALRSGEYRQTQEVLVEPDPILGDAFCCLGVLCEIAVKDGVIVRQAESYLDPANPMDQSDATLPMAVLRWAELPIDGHTANEVVVMHERYLTTFNDNFRYDFNQIADVIEEKL
jgi:hypothetical protein